MSALVFVPTMRIDAKGGDRELNGDKRNLRKGGWFTQDGLKLHEGKHG